jgi:hypothetical protein
MSQALDESIAYTTQVMKESAKKKGKDSPEYKQQAEKLKMLKAQKKNDKQPKDKTPVGSSSKKKIIDQINKATDEKGPSLV